MAPKTIMLILIITTVRALEQHHRQAKEIPSNHRRQFVSYSTNVVHENPSNPDQSAQSSVKVSFNPTQEQKLYSSSYGVQQSQQYKSYQQPQPAQYYQQFQQQQTQPQPQYQSYQSEPQNPQSQLFNVGYSVSFTNPQVSKQPPTAPPSQPQPKYTRINNLDNGEIITGTRKRNEEVQIPNINMSPQDFVNSALIDSKKHKISGTKSKLNKYSSGGVYPTQSSKLLLSPTTQKYYKSIEQAKPHVQNTQDLQQKYTWRSLGPGVEIIRSTEVPTRSFDHAKALGRSQDFDYSNALGLDNSQQQSQYYYTKQNALPPITRVLPQQPQITATASASYPVDTSLLRETVPIQIDTRLIEEAMKSQQLAHNSKLRQQYQDTSSYPSQYRTLPVQLTKTSYNNKVNSEEKDVYSNQEQDYQQPDQSRFQYKIYGKPQPLTGFEHHQSQRQPRFLGELQTNLRPPPFTANINPNYQRRILIG